MAEKLKLIAHDTEDLQIVSACLQDAICRVGDMAYQSGTHRFATIFNRFRWENPHVAKGRRLLRRPHYERVRTAIHFNSVMAVRKRGIDQLRPEQRLNLLAIDCTENTDKTVQIRLLFAGGAEILLEAECVDCIMEDISAPWPVRTAPKHTTDAQS
ncbi:MAG TPA: DUF2948 domain-containing protein [Alphaproteobacteria bacterium]|nr:DUF2948 domain-containing protein [Alphaproteobacteria bacterium]HBA42860.1 DUF2948 domain-containing protein [Alphaproteobacteria bacterium]HBC53376.1 DUF2948 domain-containing protein [Alphaproteobacteria bacterium]HBF96954.1 DUF2948 domain-containing protein [Alphaproteobacteria bacterium]HCO91915.1 DUF2948 domain-containing protein [Alphaproteobacteria bacterium]